MNNFVDIFILRILLIEFNCSFMTPTNAHLVCINMVLYHSYTFWCDLCHLQTALHPDLKLTKI